MKTSPVFPFLGLCAAGLLVGYAGNRLASGNRAAVAPPATGGNHETPAPSQVKPGATLPKLPVLHSTDTLASLATADAGSLYGRLALWLMDASAADIAAYWASFAGNKDQDDGIINLVFMHWTRLDPQGAIAAVANTNRMRIPWFNWACHDPQAALAAAIATDPLNVRRVAMGIGCFHPAWLLEHFDEIPAAARDEATDVMTELSNTDQPLKVLEFLTQHHCEFHPSIFEALVRQDPWAAYDWMRKNPKINCDDPFAGGASMMSVFLKTAAESQPAALERLAAQTPSGSLRRQMETALFDHLLETDPAAALEQASAIKAPAIAAERLASVGLSQAHTDPDQAFETARKLFAANAAPLTTRTVVRRPGGYSLSSSSNLGVGEFMDTLAAKDPVRLMALLPPPHWDESAERDDYREVAYKCAKQDLAAYSAWVRQQTNPAILAAANPAGISVLMNEQRFPEAAEWAMSSDRMHDNLSNLLDRWHQSDPAQARQWLDAAALPTTEKAQLSKSLEDTP